MTRTILAPPQGGRNHLKDEIVGRRRPFAVDTAGEVPYKHHTGGRSCRSTRGEADLRGLRPYPLLDASAGV